MITVNLFTYTRCYITVFFCVVNFLSFGQHVSPKIDSIVNTKPKEISVLDELFTQFSNDSLTLQVFYDASYLNDYFLGQTYALNKLGIYCRNNSEYDKAIVFHKSALKLSRTHNFISSEIEALNMLGVVYRRLDAIRTALDNHKEALAIAESIEPQTNNIKKSIAVSLNSMGNIYLALDQYDLAIKRFKASLNIEEEVGNNLGLAINYHNIGYAKAALGHLDDALVYYNKSLAYNKLIDSKLGIVICNASIGTLLIRQQKDEEAIKIMTAVLNEAKVLKDKFHLASVYSSLGWAYLNTKSYKLSKFYLDESILLAKTFDFKSTLELSYKHLATLASQQGDFKKAYRFTKLSREMSDALNKSQNFQYVNDIIIKYDTEKINNKLRSIEQEREIDKLRYRKNKNILIGSCLLLVLIVVLTYILYRQRLLRNEKRIILLEQDILRSQMNPHFVFNSLNSIKQYIITNDQKKAAYYLNKFAKLMRKILEASKTKRVSLSEEIETITLYFNIENIRFSNEISLDTYVEDTVDIHHIKIPSLILQPFIENAIWHGLSSKSGSKKISLKITKPSTDAIRIEITDNGIGRAKSAKIQSHKFVNRKSFGLQLTKARLNHFIKDYSRNFDLSFEDLFDGNNIAQGTRVILVLPLQ